MPARRRSCALPAAFAVVFRLACASRVLPPAPDVALRGLLAGLSTDLALAVLAQAPPRYQILELCCEPHIAVFGSEGLRRELHGSEGEVRGLTVFAQGQRVLGYSGGESPVAIVWDAISGRILREFRHAGSVTAAVALPGGERVVSCSEGGTCVVWSVASGESLVEIPVRVFRDGLEVLAPGDRLVTWRSLEPAVWSVASGEQVCQFPDMHLLADVARSYLGGRRLVTSELSTHATIWDAASCERLHVLEHGDADTVVDIGVLHDSGTLAVIMMTGLVHTWRVDNTFESLRTFGILSVGGITSLLPFPDGRRLVTYTARAVSIWNSTSGDLLRDLPGVDVKARGVALSPDGGLLAVCGGGGAIEAWDTDTGLRLMQSRGAHDGEEGQRHCRVAVGLVPPLEPNSFGPGLPWRFVQAL